MDSRPLDWTDVSAVLSASFSNETLDDQSKRIVLKIPPALAPVKAAITTCKKDGLPGIADIFQIN